MRHTKDIYHGGWVITISYGYHHREGQFYGAMEDCYESETSFEYSVISYVLDDDPENSCTKEEVVLAMGDEDFVYDLLVNSGEFE
ncbi:hypothetical protein N9937_00790 [bacterium]|nr:hypothetical protein [bacterium]